jgi:hypothetical protein
MDEHKQHRNLIYQSLMANIESVNAGHGFLEPMTLQLRDDVYTREELARNSRENDMEVISILTTQLPLRRRVQILLKAQKKQIQTPVKVVDQDESL